MEDPNQKKKNEQKINILSKYQEFYESSVEWGKLNIGCNCPLPMCQSPSKKCSLLVTLVIFSQLGQ
jgi:hypothetical protein